MDLDLVMKSLLTFECLGLSCLSKLGMGRISAHVGSLTRHLLRTLRSYCHPNGRPVVKMHPYIFMLYKCTSGCSTGILL